MIEHLKVFVRTLMGHPVKNLPSGYVLLLQYREEQLSKFLSSFIKQHCLFGSWKLEMLSL